MTDEQKDALAGKLMFEHGTLVKEIAILEAEADRFGRVFVQAGILLSKSPQSLIFNRVSFDSRFGGQPAINIEELDGKRVLELTNEIRVKIVRRDEIIMRLKGMGINL